MRNLWVSRLNRVQVPMRLSIVAVGYFDEDIFEVLAFKCEVSEVEFVNLGEDFLEVGLVEGNLEVVFVEDLRVVWFEGRWDLFDLGFEGEGEGFFVAEGADEFFGLVEGDELAIVDDGGAMAKLFGFFEVVSCEEDGGAGGVEFVHVGREVVA